MTQIRVAAFPADLDVVRALFTEYAASLPIDIAYQGFAHELETLPGAYAAPRGTVLVAERAGVPLGCVALRPFAWPHAAELKRLYVSPMARGLGIARALCVATIEQARAVGYREILLDSLPTMHAAQALYRTLGFTETPSYRETPVPGIVFMTLVLSPPDTELR